MFNACSKALTPHLHHVGAKAVNGNILVKTTEDDDGAKVVLLS